MMSFEEVLKLDLETLGAMKLKLATISGHLSFLELTQQVLDDCSKISPTPYVLMLQSTPKKN